MQFTKPGDGTHSDDVIHAFCELLGMRVGLQVRNRDKHQLSTILVRRCRSLGLNAEEYLKHLRAQNDEEGEWKQLLPLLTNGESYFERDKGQFDLLKTKVLPELIEKRRARNERALHVWSAGCSTGEETYSLAMTLDLVLPSGWSATILGTDINAEALQKAQRGIYNAWSFRGVDSATQGAYFNVVEGGWQIAASLRRQVTFRFCNLSVANWPDAKRGINDMDLIVCRNVLIYLHRPIVADILGRFVRTLRPGGFLMTGHAELHDQNVSPLLTRLFTESAMYQKADDTRVVASDIPRQSLVSPTFPSKPQSSPAAQTFPSRSLPLTYPTRSSPASASTRVLSIQRKTADTWCQEARQYANRGEYENALACCRSAIQVDASFVDTYLVWAQICEEQGRWGEAKNLLRKIIYLAPSQAEAYVELAALHEREGDFGRARQMRLSALELLRTSSEETLIPAHAELLRHLQEMFGDDSITSPSKTKGGES